MFPLFDKDRERSQGSIVRNPLILPHLSLFWIDFNPFLANPTTTLMGLHPLFHFSYPTFLTDKPILMLEIKRSVKRKRKKEAINCFIFNAADTQNGAHMNPLHLKMERKYRTRIFKLLFLGLRSQDIETGS